MVESQTKEGKAEMTSTMLKKRPQTLQDETSSRTLHSNTLLKMTAFLESVSQDRDFEPQGLVGTQLILMSKSNPPQTKRYIRGGIKSV